MEIPLYILQSIMGTVVTQGGLANGLYYTQRATEALLHSSG